MIKILHVPTGEFISFESSTEYDRNHNIDDLKEEPQIINLEDSYVYRDMDKSIEEIKHRIVVGASGNNTQKLKIQHISELEVIYD